MSAVGGRARGYAAAAALALVALAIAWDAGVKSAAAVPDALRVLAAALALFTAAGYAPTRLLAPRALGPHFVLLAPCVGAAVSAMALTLLGFLHVPIEASLAVVIAGGAAGALVLRRRRGPARAEAADLERAGGDLKRLLWPAFIVALILSITLIPMWRAGFATTTGQNGDAVLAVGVADFLQNTPPRGEDISLYVDRMPDNWRSKYPIYYVLGGVSELSGLEATKVIAPMMSLMLAGMAVGFFLFAYHVLALGALGSLLVMGLVPFSRIMVYLAVQPFYNQIWGEFALAFILLFGFWFLRDARRATAALALLFATVGVFAYPLMPPFPLMILGLAALILWRRARARGERPEWLPTLRMPSTRRARIAAVAGAVLAAPAVLVGVLGVAEKGFAAAEVVLPGSDLTGWNALPFYLPFHKFFGLTDPFGLAFLGVAALLAAAAYACLRLPREIGLPFAATAVASLLVGAYFKARTFGAFFYFKDLSFLGPLVTLLAVAGLWLLVRDGSRRLRTVGIAALGALVLATAAGARLEAGLVEEQLSRDLLELRNWSADLPPRDSVLIGLPQDGSQLWAGYLLADRPVSAISPLAGTTFPFPPQSLAGDYLLLATNQPRPDRRIVTGRPVRENGSLRLWRMRADLPYADASSRRTLELFSSNILDR